MEQDKPETPHEPERSPEDARSKAKAKSKTKPQAHKAGPTLQVLSFCLDGDLFALAIERVREVLEVVPVTKVPRTPDFMRGVINLRGNVVPVVDLKQKFDLGETEDKVDTCIIITEVMIDDEPELIGALADSVQEVIEIPEADIGPPPRIGTRLRTEYLSGMGRHHDRFLMVLNIDRVFSSEELAAVQEGGAMPVDDMVDVKADPELDPEMAPEPQP